MAEPSLRLSPQAAGQLVTLRQRRATEARQLLSAATSQVDQRLGILTHACQVLSTHQAHQLQVRAEISSRPQDALVSAVLLRRDHEHTEELAHHEKRLKDKVAQAERDVEKARQLAAATRRLLMQYEQREKQARDLLERVVIERRTAQERREEQDIAELAMMRQSSARLTRQYRTTSRHSVP
ncbi:hypothetical protein HKD21_00880 [Gluconobacter cerevisiae]|uniref:Type III secretion protein n=1 Tax=Gluconobacter cerevisiae TaxID=1379734 RepID=A0ABR9YAL3_9PROT|nr:hypothetical protein [Gluconobacter cerevisiae]MBF0875402.1 hypothetical protein [Gluconobacter cerevisiae]